MRAGTTAAKLPGKVAGAEIKRRAGILRALGEDKRRRFIERFCGSKLKVLLEERGADGRLKGYSRNYVRVLVEGPDTLGNDEVEVVASRVEGVPLAGEIVEVQGGARSRRSHALKTIAQTWSGGSTILSSVPSLLGIALTHPSAAVGADLHYERLEFLGDAVLDLAIADLLMRRLPEAKEGVLSKERASIVNGRTLAAKAQDNRRGPGASVGQGRGEKRRTREGVDSCRVVRGRDRRDLYRQWA